MDNSFLPYFIQEQVYLIEEVDPENSDTGKADLSNAEPGIEEKVTPKPKDLPEDEPKKPVTVIVDSGDRGALEDYENKLLEKILQSVNLSSGDVHLYHFSEIKNSGIPLKVQEKLLSFGADPGEVFPESGYHYYQIIRGTNNKGYLFADTLQALNNDRNKKRKLWEKLQKLFFQGV